MEDAMAELLTLDNLFTFLMLTALQAVLGFDNLLYISIESKRVRADKQAMVRKIGIGLAILLRLVLLFAILSAVQYFQTPFFEVHWTGVVEGEVNVHAFITLIGGAFIIYTAVKEIMHMLAIDDLEGHAAGKATRSVAGAITWIVAMNLIFSFDSILSAMALTNVFVVMAAAIVVSGLGMIYLADRVSDFLQKNRMYEVLGLFVLFIVGIMLLSEGGHLAHLAFFGYKVEAMAKSTFYFVLAVLVIVDIVQGRYQKKLLAQREREVQMKAEAAKAAS
jgi:predicted tellurium resistance membrane protein TerC